MNRKSQDTDITDNDIGNEPHANCTQDRTSETATRRAGTHPSGQPDASSTTSAASRTVVVRIRRIPRSTGLITISVSPGGARAERCSCAPSAWRRCGRSLPITNDLGNWPTNGWTWWWNWAAGEGAQPIDGNRSSPPAGRSKSTAADRAAVAANGGGQGPSGGALAVRVFPRERRFCQPEDWRSLRCSPPLVQRR